MFYFQHLLNTALAGIDGTVIVPTVTSLAFAILLIGFLIGLYQAAFRGGDLQALAVTAVKYLVVAMIVANWASVFRSVNGSFNSMANSIGSSSGAGDMFQSWMGQLQQQFANNPSLTLTDLITGDAASTITVVLLVVAYLLYALAMIFFCFFYTLFGAVLYVIGPLVLALIPISGVGQLGKAYAINVMVWNAWGVLYAVFGALITAIQGNQINNVLGNGFLGFLKGTGDSVMLGLVSIFYALAIALIRRCCLDVMCARACGFSCNRRVLSWNQWIRRRGESGSSWCCGVRRCGRFIDFDTPDIFHSAARTIDARFHSVGSGECHEQQPKSGTHFEQQQPRPRCCGGGQPSRTWDQLSPTFSGPTDQLQRREVNWKSG